MSTEFCTHCKQSHPGQPCDYNDQGECAETQTETPATTSAPKTTLPPPPARGRA